MVVTSYRFYSAWIIAIFVAGLVWLSPVHAQNSNVTPVESTPSAKTVVVTVTPSIPPERLPPPSFGANWFETPASNKKGYDVFFDWTVLPNVRGYSIQITKIPGSTPQKRIGTYKTEWTFKNVTPGNWYVNLIAQTRDPITREIGWSDIYYWEITVGPRPSPTPTPDTAEVLSIKTKVENMLRRFNGASNVPSNLVDEEADTLLDDPLSDLDAAGGKTSSKFKCDCNTTCKEVRSCAEASFLLFQCGCGNLDADNDSVPCENKCGEN